MTSKLKEAREKAGYTIEEVSEILKIRKQYIVSLEEEDFSNIPGQVYVDGYTKMYYELLGLEFTKKPTPIIKEQISKKRGKKLNKKSIALVAMCMLVLVVLLYALLKSHVECMVEEDLIVQNEINFNAE